MREENIEKMNFKELRSEVQYLRDELAIFKRKYEDAIYNLNGDNFGKSFTVEQNGMKAQIKITADAIKTKVSDTDLQKELEKYSTIEQTADAITTTVTSDYVKDLVGDYYVTGVTFNSVIEQTASSISGIVSKNISAYFEKTVAPTKNNTSAKDKAMLCLYGGDYYYFNDVKDEWLIYPASGLKTMFKQTSSGFELTGDVSISGDLITSGAIRGLTVGTNANAFGDGVQLNSEKQRFEVMYNSTAVGYWMPSDGPVGSTIGPASGSALKIDDVTAIGEWDFSACTVTGLSVTAKFG